MTSTGSRPAWRKPSFARWALTDDEALITDSLRLGGGLRCDESRAAGLRAALKQYETAPPPWWISQGRDDYADAMEEMVATCRRWREHGCPRTWPIRLHRFWYWVALRQQYEDP